MWALKLEHVEGEYEECMTQLGKCLDEQERQDDLFLAGNQEQMTEEELNNLLLPPGEAAFVPLGAPPAPISDELLEEMMQM
jgi:hypothetical protein